MQATAQAQPNIALVKYWGKQPSEANLPSVASLSITLDSLWTRTRIRFHAAKGPDRLFLNGREVRDPRVDVCLDRLRGMAGIEASAEIETTNNFPTGAGLASSASGFAALITAGDAALQLNLSAPERSRLARMSSGSAARSIFGGFVEMPVTGAAEIRAKPLLAADAWPVRILVAVTSTREKRVSSTAGMEQTARTSDFYAAWVGAAHKDFAAARRAVRDRDFETLAEISEASCLKMHGLMLSTRPGLVYWNGATVEAIHEIRRLRDAGVPVFFTIDAGPQVKAVCLPDGEPAVKTALSRIPGVLEVLASDLGPGARLLA